MRNGLDKTGLKVHGRECKRWKKARNIIACGCPADKPHDWRNLLCDVSLVTHCRDDLVVWSTENAHCVSVSRHCRLVKEDDACTFRNLMSLGRVKRKPHIDPKTGGWSEKKFLRRVSDDGTR